MVAQPKHYYTPEEYLALERAAEYKSEYLNGEIFAMSGACKAHQLIAGNIFWQLRNTFQGRPCWVYISEMRVRIAPSGLYTYPDLVALCGPEQFTDTRQDTLLNPTVIFEVLSPSTEAYDRTKKFDQYGQLHSLTDYVLVAQDRMEVFYYTRQGDGWFRRVLSSPDETLRLESINAALPLPLIYENVELPAPPATQTQP